MIGRLVVLWLLLPVGSVIGPEEYRPTVSEMTQGEVGVVFSVYNSNYGGVRFNVSAFNRGELVHVKTDWGYFNAEVYDLSGSYLGDVRGLDESGYWLFLAPGGTHTRSWQWDKMIHVDGESMELDTGTYDIVGVFRLSGEEIRTERFNFTFSKSYYPPSTPMKDPETLEAEYGAREISARLFQSSAGVLVAGFFEDRAMAFLRTRTGWRLEWSKNRTILWMVTVVFSILLLGLTQSSVWIYRLVS